MKQKKKRETLTWTAAYLAEAIQPGPISIKPARYHFTEKIWEEVVVFLVAASSSVAPGRPSILVDAPDARRRPRSL
jgi:hypothetical protein